MHVGKHSFAFSVVFELERPDTYPLDVCRPATLKDAMVLVCYIGGWPMLVRYLGPQKVLAVEPTNHKTASNIFSAGTVLQAKCCPDVSEGGLAPSCGASNRSRRRNKHHVLRAGAAIVPEPLGVAEVLLLRLVSKRMPSTSGSRCCCNFMSHASYVLCAAWFHMVLVS